MVVGIETDRGPWVAALFAAGYTVFPVNPRQASRYRERHGVSGAKSDGADAHVLAELSLEPEHQRGHGALLVLFHYAMKIVFLITLLAGRLSPSGQTPAGTSVTLARTPPEVTESSALIEAAGVWQASAEGRGGSGSCLA
jgi:Transposase